LSLQAGDQFILGESHNLPLQYGWVKMEAMSLDPFGLKP
jgi:hypothetical protein